MQLTTPEVIKFQNPPPLFGEYDEFRLGLKEGILTVEMKKHYATVQEARDLVERFLKDWSLFFALDLGLDAIPMKFVFENAHQIDRSPSPQILGQVSAQGHIELGGLKVQGFGTCTPPVHKEYPPPPSGFRASPDVETMWFRYRQCIDGKEPLASMGYFCLSMLQWSTGSKKARAMAAQMYKIDEDVLKKLGELTSERGAPSEARKLDTTATLVPLTETEQRWLRQAVKRMILRKGEYDHDPAHATSLNQIGMSQLPEL